MVSNYYIEEVMKNVKGFKGVFSSNNIPLLKQNNSSLILNFDKEDEPGSHFIAVFLTKNHLLYFDSLNLGFTPIDIAVYINKYKKCLNMSQSLQNFNSDFCGFYCILFILANLIGEKYWSSIEKKFKFQDLKNDSVCINLICKTIKKFSLKIKK